MDYGTSAIINPLTRSIRNNLVSKELNKVKIWCLSFKCKLILISSQIWKLHIMLMNHI